MASKAASRTLIGCLEDENKENVEIINDAKEPYGFSHGFMRGWILKINALHLPDIFKTRYCQASERFIVLEYFAN
ncbi:hypothetical protein VE03_10633, partial [Pseudogymnoascus sp. 23342-1-I1]